MNELCGFCIGLYQGTPKYFIFIVSKQKTVSEQLSNRIEGHAMAHPASCRLLPAEDCFRSQAGLCGIGETETRFSQVRRFFSVNIIPSRLHIYSFIHLSQMLYNLSKHS